MISKKYTLMAQQLVKKIFPQNESFIFGGAARNTNYGDVDIAIKGISDYKKILELYDVFEYSNFPKTVDLIDFDNADDSFKEYVLLYEKKIWI